MSRSLAASQELHDGLWWQVRRPLGLKNVCGMLLRGSSKGAVSRFLGEKSPSTSVSLEEMTCGLSTTMKAARSGCNWAVAQHPARGTFSQAGDWLQFHAVEHLVACCQGVWDDYSNNFMIYAGMDTSQQPKQDLYTLQRAACLHALHGR